MKFTVHIDPDREEEVQVYARSHTPLVEELRRLAEGEPESLPGYAGPDRVLLQPEEVCCFLVEQERTYALVGDRRWQVKYRLYELETRLPRQFVRIHKSCIANLQQIQRFSVAFSGTLQVVFKNGHVDYVSRRNVSVIKERLGIK